MRKMHTPYGLIIDCALCGICGFGLRYAQDRKKEPKPDAWFQFMASCVLTLSAYFSYPFYIIKFCPFELFVITLSWLGVFIVTALDNMAQNGILIYMRKLAEDFLAFTKKKEL